MFIVKFKCSLDIVLFLSQEVSVVDLDKNLLKVVSAHKNYEIYQKKMIHFVKFSTLKPLKIIMLIIWHI